MADTVSKEKRSEIMSHVTGKETKPEIIVRKYLFARGLRYRKNVKQYLLMVVSGMVIKGADTLIYHQPILNIGRKKLQII